MENLNTRWEMTVEDCLSHHDREHYMKSTRRAQMEQLKQKQVKLMRKVLTTQIYKQVTIHRREKQQTLITSMKQEIAQLLKDKEQLQQFVQENEEELNAFRHIFHEMKLSGTSLKADMLIKKISECQILENKLEKQAEKMEQMER